MVRAVVQSSIAPQFEESPMLVGSFDGVLVRMLCVRESHVLQHCLDSVGKPVHTCWQTCSTRQWRIIVSGPRWNAELADIKQHIIELNMQNQTCELELVYCVAAAWMPSCEAL